MTTSSTRPPMPIIVGVGRSGTTLLRLMLDAHPQLAIPPETGFLLPASELQDIPGDQRERLFETITGFETWRRMQLDDQALWRRLLALAPFDLSEGIRCFYRLYAERFGKPRWGDKTPYYIGHLDKVERLLPESRFIHVIRDGRDVAISMRGLWFAPADDMRTLARMWVKQVEAGRRLGAACRHYTEVRFEALVGDPTTELRRVCEFLELQFDDAMLHHADTARERLREMTRPGTVDKPSDEIHEMIRFATGPADPSRAERWRRDMSSSERIDFELVAGPLLERLGYGRSVGRPRRLVSRVKGIMLGARHRP